MTTARNKKGDKVEIIRVFPRRTSLTPRDSLAFIGDPPMIRPSTARVDISVTFTWDLPLAYRLYQAWSQYYDQVNIGGPALGSNCEDAIPGRYINGDVVFTSRGCDNKCPWCLVPAHEGLFRSIPYKLPPHPIIQDNNILQHDPTDLGRLMKRLEGCSSVAFVGGLDSRLVDERVAYMLSRLKIKQLFLACDTEKAIKPLSAAASKLSFLRRDQLRCYVMVGFNNESIAEAEERLEAVWDTGCLPFAQLYQPPDKYLDYPSDWKKMARRWSRPAIMKAMHRVESDIRL